MNRTAVNGRARGWRLPDVQPHVARRRRVLFATVLVVAGAGLAWPLLDAWQDGIGQAAVRTAASAAPRAQLGCTLRVGSEQLVLPVRLAMTLTDLAGRDQNAAAPLTTTTRLVVAAWPGQAAQAEAIARSLRGYVPAALGCTSSLPSAMRQGMQPDGLTERANGMWTAVKSVFGPLPAGGFMPGGVHAGHVPGSAHYEGRAIDFLYRPITAKSIRHGWVLAQWLVAHAQPLQIATVIFDARVWTPGGWDQRGWQPYVYPDGTTTNLTLLHYDHVHVDVQRGSGSG